jgi:hypothetical protein
MMSNSQTKHFLNINTPNNGNNGGANSMMRVNGNGGVG